MDFVNPVMTYSGVTSTYDNGNNTSDAPGNWED